jgi:hypothetical protein
MPVSHSRIDTGSMKNGPFQGFEYVGKRDRCWLARQKIAPLCPSMTFYQTGILHGMKNLFKKAKWNPLTS